MRWIAAAADFLPSSDSLEDRQLLSTTAGLAPASAWGDRWRQRHDQPLWRGSAGSSIEGGGSRRSRRSRRKSTSYRKFAILYWGMLNKDGYVPQPAVANIQNDLLTFVASLHARQLVDLVSSFNLDLRKALNYEDITPVSNADLNRDFGAVLLFASGVNADRRSRTSRISCRR